MQSPEIVVANYALPLSIMLSGTLEHQLRYIFAIGGRTLRAQQLNTPAFRQILYNDGRPEDLSQVSQIAVSYRSEKTWAEVAAWAANPHIPLLRRPDKLFIATASKLMLPHKDESYKQVRAILNALEHTPEVIVQGEAEAVEYTLAHSHARLLLNTDVVKLAPAEDLRGKGVFHMISSMPLVTDDSGKIIKSKIAALAPIVTAVDAVWFRPDLIHFQQNKRNLKSWLNREDTMQRRVLAELRDAGADIKTVTFAQGSKFIPSFSTQREIISSLREI
jgi:hypothetical protein